MVDNKHKTKKCKHLCTECVFCQTRYDINSPDYSVQSTCTAYKKKDTISCVTGNKTSIPASCEQHNKNGLCKKFKPLSHIRLRNLLREYLSDNPHDCFDRNTIENALVEDLLRRIDGEQSKYLEEIFDGDTPFEHAIIVSKSAIKDSLSHRGYKLDCQRAGDSYGDLGEVMDKQEYDKKKSWIKKVYDLFGE